MIHSYTGPASMPSLEEIFARGHALLVPWSSLERERAGVAMARLVGYLAQLPATPSFGGINALDADRQTLWVASTGLGEPFHRDRAALAGFDGDAQGGERGLRALERDPPVREALEDLRRLLDAALEIGVQAAGLRRHLPRALLERLTVRYRAIRYAPVEREIAGIGFHPDGNVLSALVSDRPGLVIHDPSGECRPTTDGVVLMPGSILYRWSSGRFKPTFHSVEIRRGDATKFTLVAFLNFPDHTEIPRSIAHGAESFFNDVQRQKEDDMNRRGDLAALWSALDQE